MRKTLMIATAIAVICIIGFGIAGCSTQGSRVSNDDAEKDKKGRYLTVVNKTNLVINEVHVVVGNGTEIDGMRQTNPDETSFSIAIPDAYVEHTTFTVILVDRYGLKYQKTVDDVPVNGRTEVVVSQDDYLEEADDFWNKLDKWFNGD